MANLTQMALSKVGIGDEINFTVKDYNDTIKYSGRVVAICDYQTARSFEDVVARHQAMLAADSHLNKDISVYRFLIVEGYDGIRRPFAFDPSTGVSWFTNDEVEVIDPVEVYCIVITGVNAQGANIALRILKEQGYSCNLYTEDALAKKLTGN